VRWWRNCTAFGRCWSYWWWDERSRWPPLKIGPNRLMWKLTFKWSCTLQVALSKSQISNRLNSTYPCLWMESIELPFPLLKWRPGYGISND
jgi:hypothetical protein